MMTPQQNTLSRPQATNTKEHMVELSPDKARLWARAGVLAAFALVLSYVETFIPLPIPIPGAKLGLANIAILIALQLLDAKSALAIACIKTLATGLLFGSPLMIPYSAAGTLLAFAGMAALVRVPQLHTVLVSIIGSMLHVVGQLAVASVLLGTAAVWFTLPALLIVACLTGALTGTMAAKLERSLRLPPDEESATCAMARNAHNSAGERNAAVGEVQRETHDTPFPQRTVRPLRATFLKRIDPRIMLGAFALYLVSVLCSSSAATLGLCVFGALLMAFAVNLRMRDAWSALAPLASILIITSVAHILYAQQGDVIATIGSVTITQEALSTIASMFVRLICMAIASVALMRIVSTAQLIEALEWALNPLGNLGFQTKALTITLDLTFQFIPVILASFKQLKSARQADNPHWGKGGLFAKIRAYSEIVDLLARSAFAHADNEAARLAKSANT